MTNAWIDEGPEGEEYTLDLVHETKDAYKVSDGNKEFWLPKSRAILTEETYNRLACVFIIPDWLATNKGIV